jgi:hypothetical protein
MWLLLVDAGFLQHHYVRMNACLVMRLYTLPAFMSTDRFFGLGGLFSRMYVLCVCVWVLVDGEVVCVITCSS